MSKKDPYMSFYYGKKSENGIKQPYQQRYCENKAIAFENTKKTVAPVALDTNKTRRKNTLLPLPDSNRKKTAKEVGTWEPVNIPK